MSKSSLRLIVAGILLITSILLVMPEFSCRASISQNQQPVEISSVLGPLPPINPAGAIVEITLKNVSAEPIISLTANLEANGSFEFVFDVTPSNPLLPNKSTSSRLTLIGGGFNTDLSYPLTINAILQNGARFVYTNQVKIIEPPLNK